MAKIKVVNIDKTDELQCVIGHGGFIKTAEDLYEALVNAVPGIKFGLAFVEASGPCLIRSEGNDKKLQQLAEKNALAIGAGHTFIVLFKNAFPINIANSLKTVPEVARLYCATSNPLQVVVATTVQGGAVLGVIDGKSAKGIEREKHKKERRALMRKFGYKLG